MTDEILTKPCASPTATTAEPEKTAGYLKKIAKNAGITGLGNIIGEILGPILGIISTRALGAELYGIYNLATYWFNLLADLSRLGFGGMLVRFTAGYKGKGRLDQAKGAIMLTLKIALINGGALTLLMLLFAEPFCALVIKQPEAAPAFRFYSFSILFTAVYGSLIAALAGFQEQRYVVFTRALVANIVKLVSLVLLLAFGLKLYAALASSLLRDLTILILGAIFLAKVFPGWRDVELAPALESKKLWKFSGTLFATSIFNQHARRLDVLFLGMFRPLTEVGLYALAVRLQPIIYAPHRTIIEIFSPIVAELHGRQAIGEIESLYKTVTKWTASASIPICLTVALFYEPILKIFGKEFHGAASALLILGIGSSFADMFGLGGEVINMTGKASANLVNSIATTMINVVLLITFIPPYGIIGAAAAYAISTMLINFLRLAQVYRFLKIHPFKLSLWKVFAAATVAFLAVYFLQSANFFSVLPGAWILELIFLWLVYALTMWALQFDAEDRVIFAALKRRFTWLKARKQR